MILKRKYKIVLSVMILTLIVILCGVTKERILTFILKTDLKCKINNNMYNLDLLIREINGYEGEVHKVIEFDDVENNECVKELFNNFDLEEIYISVDNDEILQTDTVYVLFIVKNKKLLLTPYFSYGIYYNSSDEPIGFFDVGPSEEGENYWLGFHYKYHTKQLKNKWWYYDIRYY